MLADPAMPISPTYVADPAMPISPTYVAAGHPLCKPFVNTLCQPTCRQHLDGTVADFEQWDVVGTTP